MCAKYEVSEFTSSNHLRIADGLLTDYLLAFIAFKPLLCSLLINCVD